MPHRIHTDHPDVDCERRLPETGLWAWLRRNLTLPAALTIIGMLGILLVAAYGFTAKVQAGADAKIKVEAMEKDYVSKREFEGALNRISNDIRNGFIDLKNDVRDVRSAFESHLEKD